MKSLTIGVIICSMNIEWKNIGDNESVLINTWLSSQDKHNLCMTKKSWKQTAIDIDDCLKYMDNAQFKNIMGFIFGKPAVAVMFGIEQGEILNLYNIVVNPACRNMGVATKVISKLLNHDNSLRIEKSYKKVVVSALPDNFTVHNLLKTMGFNNLGFNGEYVVFEKDLVKIDEKTL